jgi:hypothetical protein
MKHNFYASDVARVIQSMIDADLYEDGEALHEALDPYTGVVDETFRVEGPSAFDALNALLSMIPPGERKSEVLEKIVDPSLAITLFTDASLLVGVLAEDEKFVKAMFAIVPSSEKVADMHRELAYALAAVDQGD